MHQISDKRYMICLRDRVDLFALCDIGDKHMRETTRMIASKHKVHCGSHLNVSAFKIENYGPSLLSDFRLQI